MIRRLRYQKWKKIIEKSGLFDAKYYLFTYHDVRIRDINPIMHYLKYGANEGRNPSNEFDTKAYYKNNPDIAVQGINPLIHYIYANKQSQYENTDYEIIKKSHFFDKNYYCRSYSDVKNSGIEPLVHFCQYGWMEGRNPSKEFDTNFYLETYKDVKEANINPLIHYIKYGKKENRIAIQKVDINFQKTVKIIKAVKNNPRLIKRAISEIKLHGLKKTIQKVKNKYNRIEDSISQKDKMKNFSELNNLFNKEIFIPDFKLEKPIDIIIPVYNGFQFLEPLIKSIIKNTSINYRILMCDDKSSDEKVLPLLKHFQEQNPLVDIILLENEQNFGFIKTVNKLVTHTQNHFVLLNTDTEVPPHWLERLMYPIFKMKNIASTTPFTNAGTICSFPNYLEDNPIFENMDLESLDQYFQYVNFEKTYIEIPTGVGFCMGVNKNLVDKIGMFDEVFGKGYGEENDWCQRALKEGYKNIHVTNLFVYHKHGGSFPSEEKKRLIAQNLALLNHKHPSYGHQVQQLIQKNKLEMLRKLIQIKIQSELLYTKLIIDHGLGGGANHYIDESFDNNTELSQLIILIRYDFNVTQTYKVAFAFKGLNYNISSSSLFEAFTFLSGFRINEIFLNSLVSYPDVKEIIQEIVFLKEKTKSKVILPIHDFFPVCPSYTLLNEKMQYCGVPANLEICKNCLINNKNEFKIFEQETNIAKWRTSWNSINKIADEIICFSNSSKEIYLKAYPEISNKIIIKPHDISGRYKKIYDPNKKIDKIIIGVLGGINEAKGAKVIQNLVDFIDVNNLNAKVVVIGEISITINSSSFEVTGRYNKKDLPDIVKMFHITQFLIPSICPETFSYTTDEIIQMGYPLIVFDIGAPAERVQKYQLGTVVKIEKLHEVLFGN